MDNKQAISYMLCACKKMDIDKKTVHQLFDNMWDEFDVRTEEEAEKVGYDYYYTTITED